MPLISLKLDNLTRGIELLRDAFVQLVLVLNGDA